MSLTGFNDLGLLDQMSYVFKNVSVYFLCARIEEEYTINLYNCGEFFAEVYFYSDDEMISKIEGISFDSSNVNLYF